MHTIRRFYLLHLFGHDTVQLFWNYEHTDKEKKTCTRRKPFGR